MVTRQKCSGRSPFARNGPIGSRLDTGNHRHEIDHGKRSPYACMPGVGFVHAMTLPPRSGSRY